MSETVLRLASRQSALAMWQATWIQRELEARHSGLRVEILRVQTSGDKILDTPLAKIGGKGLFTKEIDEALLSGRADFAVHSLKDVPYRMPEGLSIVAIPERAEPWDAFLSGGAQLQELPAGSRIGTSSTRRQAQVRRRFPGLNVLDLRGNVDSRVRKLDKGEYDGILLAAAGLKRLGLSARITQLLDVDTMLPAAGQGALALVCRENDHTVRERLAGLDHPDTRIAVTAERAMLQKLAATCQVPVAGYAALLGTKLTLRGLVASLDGRQVVETVVEGAASDPVAAGTAAGTRLLDGGARQILDALEAHAT